MKEKSDADVVASASTPTPDPTAAGSLMDGITVIPIKPTSNNTNIPQINLPINHFHNRIINPEIGAINTIPQLKESIEALISLCEINQEELVSYFSEKEFIHFTEAQINSLVTDMLEKDTLRATGDGKILQSNKESSPYRLSRSDSSSWIKDHTVLTDFFSESRKIYTNLVKPLNIHGQNCYYQPFNEVSTSLHTVSHNFNGVMWSSNDYLGFSQHPKILSAAQNALIQNGLGCCGSRVTIGTSGLHEQLESKLAAFKGTEAAMVLSSGYLTNLSFLSNLKKGTVVLFDRLCHACIIHGVLTSKAIPIRFNHNDCVDLEKKLSSLPINQNKLIFVESVYSLDGDIAPLPDICKLAKKYNAYLAVDEAHSTGTFGDRGKGIASYFNLPESDIDFRVGTLSKALGGEGGFLCSKKEIIEAYRYSQSPFIFTSSRPYPIVAGAIAAIEILNAHPNIANELQHKSEVIRQKLKNIGFDTGNSNSQIIPIMIRNKDKTFALHHNLKQSGHFLIPAVYPGVPPKTDRLRLNISLPHQDKDSDNLLEALEFYGKKLKVI